MKKYSLLGGVVVLVLGVLFSLPGLLGQGDPQIVRNCLVTGILLTIAGVGLLVLSRKLREPLPSTAHARQLADRLIGTTVVITIVVILALALLEVRKSSSDRSTSTSQSSQKVDPDPTGTWIEGDQQSVYNRLVIQSSGTYSFQTVDFTGDVKGGSSGRWSSSGRSLRFEWGGLADGGNCSGSINGPSSLTFGALTFHR